MTPPDTAPLRLICTDFDGTIFTDLESPPVPRDFQELIGEVQAQGVRWVVNTGRGLADLWYELARANLPVAPDYLVVVEREIYRRDGERYVAHSVWNERCTRTHEDLFARLRPELPAWFEWINGNFVAEVFEDPWSPFCLVAANADEAAAIVEQVELRCRAWPEITVVANHVYARLSHVDYHKGSALREVAALCGAAPEGTFIAGDHWNDLPMLRAEFGRWLMAPANAMTEVKTAVTEAGGWVIAERAGRAVAEGLRRVIAHTAVAK
jgi:hydroxymethylpyrimidine pyrophosphatase-like HAD family hydrolase